MVGRDFGGYQLLRELAVGGMGIVYLGEHRLLGRRAAIKTIRPEIANDRAFSRRFLLEARAVGSLNHPSIVRLYDFAFEEDTPYMVMEYVTGQTMEDVLAGGRILPPSDAVELLAPIAAALDHAHARGVTHRDVKPANVLLADDGRTLIMDFGLAGLANFSVPADPETFVGTPDYISPEQVSGQPVDGRADVYSLAAVIYEAVTGDKPWSGRTWMEIARRRLIEPPPVAKGVPPGFASALAAGMARQPAQRPRTATALLETLSTSLDQLSQPRAFRRTVRASAINDDVPDPGPVPAGLLDTPAVKPPLAPAVAVPAPAPSSSEPSESGTRPAHRPTLPASGTTADPPLPAVLVAEASPRRRRELDPRLPALLLILVAGVTGSMFTLVWFVYLGETLRGLMLRILWA
jgi:serine/threonine-protein kinase